jgi:hypothetical protein
MDLSSSGTYGDLRSFNSTKAYNSMAILNCNLVESSDE